MPIVSSYITINGVIKVQDPRRLREDDLELASGANYYTMRRGFEPGHGAFLILKKDLDSLDLTDVTNYVTFTCGANSVTIEDLGVYETLSIPGLPTESDNDLLLLTLKDVRASAPFRCNSDTGKDGPQTLGDLIADVLPSTNIGEYNDTGEDADRYYHYFLGAARGISPSWDSLVLTLQNTANTMYVSRGGTVYVVANDVAEPAFAAGVNTRYTTTPVIQDSVHTYTGHAQDGCFLYPETVVVQFMRQYQVSASSGKTAISGTKVILYSPQPARYNSSASLLNSSDLTNIATAIRTAYIDGLTAASTSPSAKHYAGVVDLQPTGVIAEVTWADTGDGISTYAVAYPPPYKRTFLEVTGPLWGFAKLTATLNPQGSANARIWYDISGTMTKSSPEENITVHDRMLTAALAQYTDITWDYDPIEKKFYLRTNSCDPSADADTWGN